VSARTEVSISKDSSECQRSAVEVCGESDEDSGESDENCGELH
jgi:hypothetical protein